MVAVFHGPAARLALRDGEYARHTGVVKNPSRKLLRQLKEAGVTLYVCGQSLADQGLAAGEIVPEVETATSAMSAVVNCQSDGYAYVPIR
jgi:intracellular sulfur oxidation DsrE/DsrF family protein